MQDEIEDSLPLFIQPEIGVYVIANQVLGFNAWWNMSYSKRAYNILHQLFNHPITRKAFPASLAHHFENKLGASRGDYRYDCLSGYIEEGPKDNCFYLNVVITNDDLPVILKDFTLVQGYAPYSKVDVCPLNLGEIALSPNDAFYLFANICANNQCFRLEDYRTKPYHENWFDFNLFEQLTKNSYEEKS